MTRRTRGREIALQVLYQMEQNPGIKPAEVQRFVVRRLREPVLREFAMDLVDGVRGNLEQIDGLISDVAENWRIDRMAAIDRNILRLGAFEIVLRDDIPPKVAITEALELAKRYSTAQSSRFVNGILDRLHARASEPAPKPSQEDETKILPSPTPVPGEPKTPDEA